MPWCSITIPSLPLAILKARAAEINVPVDIHYLNIQFAEIIGFVLYERIAIRSATYPEWFFATGLFADCTSIDFVNDLRSMNESEAGRGFVEDLVRHTCQSLDGCERVAKEADLFVKACVEKIRWSDYDLVGFTVTHAQVCASLLMAKQIKVANPKVKIVLGGASAQGEMGVELIERFDFIDYVVHGEGERAFCALLEQVHGESYISIPSVSRRNGLRVERNDHTQLPAWKMEESPIPNHDDFFMEVQRTRLDHLLPLSVSVEASRGCWWGAKHLCTFCGLNGPNLTFRSKPAEYFLGELLALSERHNALSFLACDTILDMRYFTSLLPKLSAADLDITFFFEIKPNLSREQVHLLASAGVVRIQPGIEALDTSLLALMKKGTTAYQNIAFLKWCREFELDSYWNLLHGFPGETENHYRNYPDLMRSIFHLQPPIDVCPITFERYSPYHLDQAAFNVHLQPSSIYDFLFPPDVNKTRLAYFFDATNTTGTAMNRNDCEKCLREIREVFREWKEHWQNKSVQFTYQKGPGFLVLYDNRPLRRGESPSVRRTILRGLSAELYLMCEEPRSLGAIAANIKHAQHNAPTTKDTLSRLLSTFVRERLMYQEGDRFLSLAVRKRRKITKGFSPSEPKSLFEVIR
jgi:ribosomal peptide maturation radical SAM protein 1